MKQLLFRYFKYSIVKKVFFLLFTITVFNHLKAQTIEITKISITPAKPVQNTDYVDPDIQLSDNLVPYLASKIYFKWDGFDPSLLPNTSIQFSLWRNDGYTDIKDYGTSYFINTSNITDSSYIAGGVFIVSGTTTYTIKATYVDGNNNEQTIAESDPWKISIIHVITNQIYNNSICCSQTTFSYPFDPVTINQASNTVISTQDGAIITSIQWQKFVSNVWTNIAGATQMSYDPPSVSINTQYRRVLTSSSGAVDNGNTITITKITEIITGNSICCSQTTAVIPFDPAPFQQATNVILNSNIPGTTFTYQWQDSIANNSWKNIIGATNNSFDPSWITTNIYYKRLITSSSGNVISSNVVSALLKPCDRPADQQNIICGDQAFYRLQHGDFISPAKILGAFISPNIARREFGFDYMMSYDGTYWFNVKPKHLLTANVNDRSSEYTIDTCYFDPKGNYICIPKTHELDYQIPSFTFDINKGMTQQIYIRRDYYHWYDAFNCSTFGIFSCGSQWHFQSSSNVVKISLTSGDFPKPVPSITGPDQATCNWSDQTMTFNVPRLNNGEYYKWEIPSTWTAYTALEGAYVNEISVNTNSGGKGVANGGQVCLTVTQGAQVDRQCKTVTGSTGFFVHSASISACDGQTVIIKPNIGDHTASTYSDPANYTFSWAAYQSPIQSCNNPAGSSLTDCKELKITVTNVKQNPTQSVGLTLTDKLGCVYTTNYVITAAPGVQMGILNNPNDPLAVSTSSLAVDATNNFLYFTGTGKALYRTYFDNTPGQLVWKYAPILDKNINIRGDGPVAIYKGTTSKLFYTYNNGTLTYAESSDNGQTWSDKRLTATVSGGVDPRIKIWGNNIYYINNSDRKVYYQAISNITGNGIPVGNGNMNYFQNMFTVEDGILAYADASYKIVAFDALSGTPLTINVPASNQQVNYNSSISTYNGNIYYIGSSGLLCILKRNASTGIYDNYEQVPNLQLAGPFAINKQTGTLYAKAYDMPGKMIYYLNNQWNIIKIQTIISDSPIVSDMTYANGHAFYIGDFGHISNTYYVAPCTPAVLRTASTTDENGDILNQSLSNEIVEDRTVLLYPNPATAQVRVTFAIPQESTIRINIIPVTGGSSDVLYNSSAEAGTQEVSVDLSNYAGGLYLIQLYVNGSLYGTSKLVKQ